MAYAVTDAAPEGSDLFYFALVNYAMLGYGDVTPVAPARTDDGDERCAAVRVVDGGDL